MVNYSYIPRKKVNTFSQNNENRNICAFDILCRNKRCSKSHPERKRLHICQYDIFFFPNQDEGCHFEDCAYKHPQRDSYYARKDAEFDQLVESVANVLFDKEDDSTELAKSFQTLMRNITNYEELECTFIEKFRKVEMIMNDLENLYNHSHITTKQSYYDFMGKFNNIVIKTDNAYHEFSDIYVRITKIYPESFDQAHSILQELLKMCEHIHMMKNYVINEYKETIHLYPTIEMFGLGEQNYISYFR